MEDQQGNLPTCIPQGHQDSVHHTPGLMHQDTSPARQSQRTPTQPTPGRQPPTYPGRQPHISPGLKQFSPEFMSWFENAALSSTRMVFYNLMESYLQAHYTMWDKERKEEYIRYMELALTLYGLNQPGSHVVYPPQREARGISEDNKEEISWIIQDEHPVIPSPSLASLVLIQSPLREEFIRVKLSRMRTGHKEEELRKNPDVQNKEEELRKNPDVQNAIKLMLIQDEAALLELIRDLYDPNQNDDMNLLHLCCKFGAAKCMSKEFSQDPYGITSINNQGHTPLETSLKFIFTEVEFKRNESASDIEYSFVKQSKAANKKREEIVKSLLRLQLTPLALTEFFYTLKQMHVFSPPGLKRTTIPELFFERMLLFLQRRTNSRALGPVYYYRDVMESCLEKFIFRKLTYEQDPAKVTSREIFSYLTDKIGRLLENAQCAQRVVKVAFCPIVHQNQADWVKDAVVGTSQLCAYFSATVKHADTLLTCIGQRPLGEDLSDITDIESHCESLAKTLKSAFAHVCSLIRRFLLCTFSRIRSLVQQEDHVTANTLVCVLTSTRALVQDSTDSSPLAYYDCILQELMYALSLDLNALSLPHKEQNARSEPDQGQNHRDDLPRNRGLPGDEGGFPGPGDSDDGDGPPGPGHGGQGVKTSHRQGIKPQTQSSPDHLEGQDNATVMEEKDGNREDPDTYGNKDIGLHASDVKKEVCYVKDHSHDVQLHSSDVITASQEDGAFAGTSRQADVMDELMTLAGGIQVPDSQNTSEPKPSTDPSCSVKSGKPKSGKGKSGKGKSKTSTPKSDPDKPANQSKKQTNSRNTDPPKAKRQKTGSTGGIEPMTSQEERAAREEFRREMLEELEEERIVGSHGYLQKTGGWDWHDRYIYTPQFDDYTDERYSLLMEIDPPMVNLVGRSGDAVSRRPAYLSRDSREQRASHPFLRSKASSQMWSSGGVLHLPNPQAEEAPTPPIDVLRGTVRGYLSRLPPAPVPTLRALTRLAVHRNLPPGPACPYTALQDLHLPELMLQYLLFMDVTETDIDL